MDPSVVFMFLVVITVCASSHPLEALDTTTFSPDDPNRIFFTMPSAADNNVSHPAIKSNADENRLEITLKMDESDKEVVDTDMGKYLTESKAELRTESLHGWEVNDREWWAMENNNFYCVNLQKGFFCTSSISR